jgi:hypothetical protein
LNKKIIEFNIIFLLIMPKILCNAAKLHQDICQHCENLYFIKFKTFKENFCSLDCKSSYFYIKNEIENKIYNVIDNSNNK